MTREELIETLMEADRYELRKKLFGSYAGEPDKVKSLISRLGKKNPKAVRNVMNSSRAREHLPKFNRHAFKKAMRYISS